MISPIRAKKSLGQNFLKDPHYLRKIVDAAAVGPVDRILEIGPGMGHLTRILSERAQKVLALELDDRLIPYLQQEFGEKENVEIRHVDALEYPYSSLPGGWKVVANLPYYISTPLIQRLLQDRSRFTTLTLMLQKEVAERIAAGPGGKEYGYLSVLVQLYSEPRIEFSVPAGAFTPRPEVDSAVITLVLRDHPALANRDHNFLIRLVKAAFSQRRKTLRNALKQLEIPASKMGAAFAETGVDLGRRAETLTVEEFAKLADFLFS
ncbi:MAG: ribosomal RNA small subunit methyltransferase A [Nitrospirae bacterium GWD2_57_9]|nr:MAG: ribosomal RNA small subunit methyltransferase A [Nitrospirae bacterium GWD2_57_9]OGW47718.1 MAG: ribosomal RNA small subunit methyltransferase A [Nitrospirae bacterium GWC2_57_9]